MSIVEPLSPTSAEFKGILPLNIIYEAGVDSESRPILVLCACNLPDPNTTNYDLILGFILGRLNEFVESDYVLVFFSSPAQYRPSWMWLLKAYRALDRRYKKNLKALYVVHLTRTYRLIFDLANKITSPKFARKLRYCSTLQELFGSIQISAQFIPQQVRKYDAQLPPMPPSPSRYSISAENKRPLPSLTFGLTLEELAALEGWEKNEARTRYIPRVVQQLTAHLRSEGLEKEGIFRKSPASDELQMVKRELNRGIEVNLSRHDVNVSASLLKIFLKELPSPLIDSALCASLGKLPDPADCSPEVLDKIKARFQEAYNDKPHHLALLQYLFEFFQQVASHADKNRMTAHNLAVVLTPNLVRGSSSPQDPFTPASQQEAMATAANYLKEMNMGMALVQILIVHHKQIFSNSG